MKRTGTSFATPLILAFLLMAGALTLQAQAAPFAYITNSGGHTITVIDTSTDKVSATISGGGLNGPYGVAVNPAGTRVYVTNAGGNAVSVINTSTNTVVDTITVGNGPQGIAVNPAGTKVYVANHDGSNSVSVIDTSTNTVIQTISVGNGPFGIAVNPAGTKVYVANDNSGTVSIIDTQTYAVTSVTVGTQPYGVAVNPAGTKVYVANFGSGSVSVIDTATNEVTSIPVGGNPWGIAVNSTGTRVYATMSNNVAVIDTSDDSVTTIGAAGTNLGISINPDDTKVYATDYNGRVSVIDASSNTVIATVGTGASPVAHGKFIGTNMCTPFPADMVSWWGGDNNALDLVDTNHGIVQNGATYAPGKINQAFSFDGTDDYVLIADPVPASLQAIQNEITIDAWIYVTEYPSSDGTYGLGLIAGSQKDESVSGASIFLDGRTNPDGQTGIPTGHIHFQIGDGTWHAANTQTPVPLNQWVHIAATRKANEDARIYYNGVLQPSISAPWTGGISYTDAWFAIGQQKDLNRPFKGLVDEVEVFNRALTVEEVAAIYNAGSAGKCRSCTPPPADMVSWWKAETDTNDSVSTNDGTLVNGPTYAAGKVGQAFSLDGTDDYVEMPHDASLSFPPASPISFNLWVKRTSSTATQHIFSKRNACDYFNYQLAFVDNTGLFFGWNDFQINTTGGASDLPLNTWTHIAGTSDGSTLKLFVNGQLAASGSGSLGPENDDPLKLGAAGTCNTGPFGGLIDETAIYNRVLSEAEIQSIYNSGSAGKCDIDTTPDAFAFTDQTGVNVNTVTTSDSITVNGIYAGDISISDCTGTNCEYQINTDGWTSLAGTVRKSDTVTVRQTSSASYSTPTDLVLDIGGVTDTFRVTTIAVPQYTVTANAGGNGSGTVASDVGGIDYTYPATSTETSTALDHGSAITLTATAGTGSTVGWTGCDVKGGTSTAATCTFSSLDADKTVTATFTLNTYTVTGNAGGNGSGTVASNVGGIDYTYPATSTETSTALDHGSAITLTATAGTGSTVGWTGCAATGGTSTAATCTFSSLDADKTVTATFTLNTYTVTGNAGGNGSGTVASNVGGIDYTYPATSTETSTALDHGSAITLTATAGTGSTVGWTGCAATGGTSTAATCTFSSLDADKTVTATFTLNTYTLTIIKTGIGTVTSNPAGIDCGTDCSENYDFSTGIVLTAVPADGGVFTGWSGGGCTGTDVCTVTIDENKKISATFQNKFPWPMFLPAITNNAQP